MYLTGLLILVRREHASFRGRDIADGNRIGERILSQGRDDVRREPECLCQDRPATTVREDYRKPTPTLLRSAFSFARRTTSRASSGFSK